MQNDAQRLEEDLIKAGFWGADEEGDPTTEENVGLILERIEERLRKDALLLFFGPTAASPVQEARVASNGRQYTLATGANLAGAIHNAALALPDFLQHHPECATVEKK